MKTSCRFIAKAEAGKGWRIWDKKTKRWWGERYKSRPDEIIDELNGAKRPSVLTKLQNRHKDERLRLK